MKAKMLTASILAAVALSTSANEVYSLKFPATVDIVEDGEVTGTKKLKAGTVVTLDEARPAAEVQEKAAAASGGKLRLSKLSPIMFKNQRPAVGHVFNAEVKLDDYYRGPYDGKEAQFWSVSIDAYNAKWEASHIFTGYAKKSDAIGRKVKAMLEDGTEKTARVKIVLVKSPDYDDLVTIEAIEPATRTE